jgi:dTDP-4-dehydrorhamnose reductase
MDTSKIFITGAKGQLGQALLAKYPNAKSADRTELDISNNESVKNYDWSNIGIIVNAAAYTNVDGAESSQGRLAAWQVNATAVANLAKLSLEKDITLLHFSTDYVYDGSAELHSEDEPFSPLSVYGQSKAAGDIAVSLLDNYYILRTSWVIGEGKNFVRTMLSLGTKNIEPTVVADQFGRLTFTSELVKALDYLLVNACDYGTYNVSNSGDVISWADITRAVFDEAGFKLTVTETTTTEYYNGKQDATAPRPSKSSLDLSKINGTGFISTDWREDLHNYVRKEL